MRCNTYLYILYKISFRSSACILAYIVKIYHMLRAYSFNVTQTELTSTGSKQFCALQFYEANSAEQKITNYSTDAGPQINYQE